LSASRTHIVDQNLVYWSSNQNVVLNKEIITTQAARGKVLGEFAENIDEGKGWWFRAPKKPTSGDKGAPKDPMHPDVIMLQLFFTNCMELAMIC
jgi:hypothetical protein